MSTAGREQLMIIAGLALAGLAALIHVFIFYLESIAWTSERARKTFGTGTAAQAEAQKALAFNQGFYNLFLAIAVFVGIVVVIAGNLPVGATLVFTGAGSMVAASLVLILSDPSKASAALKQGVVPALGVLALALGIAL
ncbi:putative membrane protein [Microbacterium paludicola]|uniref:Membrane protein n=2 Tax=Microbacterium paludicola TaxID=300019 RepID=A0ABU1I1C7_9MICO|nr:putative membrane protein [Microbacterium paludicola]